MNSAIRLLFPSALLFISAGCTNNPGPGVGPGTGPFDEAGNYREDWADDPSKWRRPGSSSRDDVPVIAKNEEPPPNANPLPPSRPSTQKVTPKPAPTVTKPAPTVAKVTPKPKPKPAPKPSVTRYTVKKGDTLSGIASRYRSSVSAIRRANGISGSLIRPGQVLVVPKR